MSQGDQKKKLAQQLKFQKRSDKSVSIDRHVAVQSRRRSVHDSEVNLLKFQKKGAI